MSAFKRVHPTNNIEADEDIPRKIQISFISSGTSEPPLIFSGETELKGVDFKNLPEELKTVFTNPYLWYKVRGETKGNQISIDSDLKISNVGSRPCLLNLSSFKRNLDKLSGWKYWVFVDHGFSLHVELELICPNDLEVSEKTFLPCKILQVWLGAFVIKE